MSNLSIYVMGSPRIEQDGSQITVDTRKAIALLAYLAVTNQAHDREKLARLLWSGDSRRGRAALRRTLSTLKKALSGNWLMIDKNHVGLLHQPGLWLDVEVYLQRLGAFAAHRHQKEDICQGCLPFLQEAISLYRDTFLSGFLLNDAAGFGQWQMVEAAFLQRKQAEALKTLSVYYTQTGEYRTAVSFAHRWLQLDSTHEPAHQWLMKLYYWQGEKEKALNQYRDCVRLLKLAVESEPQPETTSLFEQIQSGSQLDKPASLNNHIPIQTSSIKTITVRSQPVRSQHNLPIQLIPLIGREVELKEIEARLSRPHCRLLTLTGIGGVGKTRLALEFARTQAEKFEHGVCYVPLTSMNTSDYLLTMIAEALQFTFSNKDTKKQLLNYLKEKEILLVLDNFEHLLDEAPLLIEILHFAPGVKILITSRSSLNFQVEWLYEVRGLAYGDNSHLSAFGAEELFLYHGNRLHFNFKHTVGEIKAVQRICHLLEGMPLGLEIAAALLSHYSCEEIAAGIERDLDFLKTKMRDVPLQHRSLRAVFEHSWQLLSPEEQELLKQVTVFKGGFNQGAVNAIATSPPSLLINLVNSSLLHERPDGRFEMHSLIRQYAYEKLKAQESKAQFVHKKHAHYYLSFLKRWADELKTAKQGTALKILHKDMDNIRTAWNWAVNHHEVSELNRVLDGLCLLYDFNSWYHEGKTVFQQAADKLLSAQYEVVAMRVRQAFFMHRLSMYQEAKVLLLDALSKFREKELPSETVFCLIQLGTVAFFLGEYDESKTYLYESLEISQKHDDPWQLAYCYNSIGNVHRVFGEFETARQLMEKALGLRRQCGDKRGIAVTLNNLGSVAETVGDYKEAQRLIRESLKLKEELGDKKGTGLSMLNLGCVLSLLGQSEEAKKLLSDSYTISMEVGEVAGAALALTNQGNIAFSSGELAEANHYYCESLKISQTIADRRGIVFSLNDLGKVAVAQNKFTEAQSYFHRSLTLASEMNSISQMLEALAGTANLMHKYGDNESSVALLSFILNHRALDSETREYANRIKANMGNRLLSSQPKIDGQYEDLFVLTQEVLNWLNTEPSSVFIALPLDQA